MLGPFRQIRLNMIMSEENAYYFSFKDAGRWSGRWSQTSVCPVTSPPLMQSSCAEGRCLICLAGEPLISKSVSAGKGLDAARSTPFHAVGLGICTSGPVSEGFVESTTAFVGSTARGWNIVMLCGWAHGALASKRLVIAFFMVLVVRIELAEWFWNACSFPMRCYLPEDSSLYHEFQRIYGVFIYLKDVHLLT